MPSDLPVFELGFPGLLRDRLVAAVLDGTKTSTTGLYAAYAAEQEPLPEVDQRFALVDSAERPVAVIEMTGVRVVALADVDLDHARDEGEGHATIPHWRAGHTRFFESDDMRDVLGDPGFRVDDTTPVVLERFRLVRRLGQ